MREHGARERLHLAEGDGAEAARTLEAKADAADA
jgi:hypothetical protein